MEKTKNNKFWVVCILAFLANARIVYGLDPMGPPSAGLRKGQFSAGSEFSYSRGNFRLTDGKGGWQGFTNGVLANFNSGKMSSLTVENVNLYKIYANLGYGITDDWQASLRLGAVGDVKLSYKNKARPFFPVPVAGGGGVLFPDGQKADGDCGFAIGFGTKVTFYQQDALELGGLFQISWAKSDGKQSGRYPAGGGVNAFPDPAGVPWSHSVEIEITEIQVALGATYRLTNAMTVYGGPFLYLADGHVKGGYNESGLMGVGAFGNYNTDYSYDIDQATLFGGYIGTQIEIAQGINFNVEYQHTASADAIGINLLWRF